jgi:hypothetical protein
MRFVLPALMCALGLCVGCTSTCDRPSWWSRWFGNHEKCCEGGCCTEGCCNGGGGMGGSVIYDGPVLPEGPPMMTPVPGGAPLPVPSPVPGAPANGRIIPQPQPQPQIPPQVQSQPIPYVPVR